MAQIVFLLFEDRQEPEDSEDRYKVEVHFTPGGKGREEVVAGNESTNSSTESLKADISKTLLYTSLKRMVPGNKKDVVVKLISLYYSLELKTLVYYQLMKPVQSTESNINHYHQ